jgi:hypothetical protein
MANSNFVVQNGLQVGGLTIFAANSDITTSGNISVTGGGSFGGLSSNQIYQGTGSNVNVASTAVTVGIAGAGNVATFNSTGLTVSNLTVTGTETVNNTEYSVTQIATTVNAVTIGNAGAAIVGTTSTISGASSAGTLVATNLSSSNVSISGGSLTGITTLTATTTNPTTVNAGTVNAATINVTSGNITTLTATTTNPTTVNAGTVNAATLNATTGNITNANHTTMVSTNFSSGNIQATSNITLTGSIIPSSNVSSNLGNSTNWFNTFFGVATQAKYADLAENYQADKAYNPGTVLQFGGTAEVTVAEANTPRVAGVVSTNPAHLMNGALAGNGVVALALTGRVPCNVIGPVAKGDMLVSAGFGFARADASPAMGTVIGKALEDFSINAKGVIEVVVGRL